MNRERHGSPLTLIGFVALGVLALGALVMALGYTAQFADLKHTIYQRCLQRQAYDHASQEARSAQFDYYERLLINLRNHPSPQSARFNAELERSVARVALKLHAAVTAGAPTGCSQYR